MREDFVHVAVRRALIGHGWTLIAGQFPNGSDDELPRLSVMDPSLARDRSPDPRRHSFNKFVPDLVACCGSIILIVEMKPRYSEEDELKLFNLLNNRRPDLIRALRDLAQIRSTAFAIPVEQLTLVPALGFGATRQRIKPANFCHFRVLGLDTVAFDGGILLPSVNCGVTPL